MDTELNPASVGMNDFHELEKLLKYTFRDKSFLAEALTHPSYKSIEPAARDNQRLEFLGDAVLGLIFAEMLFHLSQDAAEGQLTNARSKLARGSNLAMVARNLGLASYMRFAPGTDAERIRATESVHEDALEALFGAVFVDSGIRAVRSLVKRLFADELILDPVSIEQTRSAKNRLQEIVQRHEKSQGEQCIEYRVVAEEGLPHEKLFTVEVWVGDGCWGRGTGSSKRSAGEAAALGALAQKTC
ncbi:MAG: ribonuclease III [Puniceicoccales bacterium]|nr:ribonuclease III [Puniceicoccales bacterium]